MFKHILIATDGSELAEKAIAHGIELAKHLKVKVTAVTVTKSWDALSMAALAERNIPNPVADYEERMAASANRILWSVTEAAKKLGQPCSTIYVKDRHPADRILETAGTLDCDLIVMASHGRRGLSRMQLGSQANKVVTLLSLTPVRICR